MRVNVIVATFVAVLLFSSDGLGIVAVTAGETTAAAEGGGEGETSGTATMMDGVPATATATAPRKLTKKSKASNTGELTDYASRLLRKLVLDKAVNLHRFLTQQQDPPENATRVGDDGRALFLSTDFWEWLSNTMCQPCIKFFTYGLQASTDEREEYCQKVMALIDSEREKNQEEPCPEEVWDSLMGHCMELLQTTFTPTTSCECHKMCIQPEPEPCKDTDGDEVDKYGYSCSHYYGALDNKYDWCDGRRDTDTFNPVQMCCACGGGYLAPYATCTPEAVIPCAGNFGSNHACCDQHGSCGATVELQWQCPRSMPTCVNYVYGKHWGTCEQRSTK